MVRRKMEGDEDQRRAAAREAERAGERPSARSATTGASKQRAHMADSLTHEEKMSSHYQGKQRAAGGGRSGGRQSAAREPDRGFTERGDQKYSDAHERVLRALSQAEVEQAGEGVHLDAVADAAELPKEETRLLLHDLVVTHGLVSELQGADDPDLGPRYEVKPRF